MKILLRVIFLLEVLYFSNALPFRSASTNNKRLVESSNMEFNLDTIIFQNKEDMFSSDLWNSLLKRKIPLIAKSTVIYVNETSSVYHFRESEMQESKEKRAFWTSNKRDIKLLEVQYGEKESNHVQGIPISSCISSKLSSGGASYTQSYQVGQSLTLDLDPSLSLSLMQIGATISVGTNDLILSLSNTGGITCNANPGRRVQVFGSFDYVHFPNARKRKVSFSKGNSDFNVGKWVLIITSKPNFREYGAIFYDLSKIPNFYCVDDEMLLSCDI